MFVPSQTAALAAGEQKLGWNYIELFYHEQGDETSSDANHAYLDGLAGQSPGSPTAPGIPPGRHPPSAPR